jgi:hypothetical protein
MRDLASSDVFLSHSIDLILGFDPEVGSSCDCHCCCSPPLLGKKQDMVIVLAGTFQLASLSIVTCHHRMEGVSGLCRVLVYGRAVDIIRRESRKHSRAMNFAKFLEYNKTN